MIYNLRVLYFSSCLCLTRCEKIPMRSSFDAFLQEDVLLQRYNHLLSDLITSQADVGDLETNVISQKSLINMVKNARKRLIEIRGNMVLIAKVVYRLMASKGI